MIKSIQSYLKNFAQLLYPHYCEGCGSDILEEKQLLCSQCFVELAITNFENIVENTVEKMFYGRLPIAAATAGFYFTKDSLIQHLIHQLKYNGNKDVGVYLGKLLGFQLKQCNRFNEIDIIIPLPLNHKRAFKRGYNQAALIGEGIAEVVQKPMIENAVGRKLFTETQTINNRINRLENMIDAFTIENANLLINKHVLLVDDIITTGATLEACGRIILDHHPKSLSIASVAYTV